MMPTDREEWEESREWVRLSDEGEDVSSWGLKRGRGRMGVVWGLLTSESCEESVVEVRVAVAEGDSGDDAADLGVDVVGGMAPRW